MRTKLKYRWSVSHNYLAGITAGDWWRLLRENHGRVDPIYWHRATVVSALSLMNSWNRRTEDRKFRHIVDSVEIPRSPVFILGHWRSGTTHLHNLLAQDHVHFAYANTYQVVNPHTFLTTEATHTRRFAKLLPNKRPMDNMALSFDSPQEDEFAPLLSCLLSPYLSVSFPRREDHYDRYLTFHDVSDEEKRLWKEAFVRFVKKLTFKYGRPLILKSPTHTARIRLLLEIFPDAKFVHIHRHPEEVFQSVRHYHDTAMWHTYLQRPDLEETDTKILERYRVLYDAFFEDRRRIPAGNFHEVGFADLERNPLSVTRGIYEALNLGDFEIARPAIDAYVSSLEGYQKNRFDPLSESDRQRLRDAWSPYYKRWGYEIP